MCFYHLPLTWQIGGYWFLMVIVALRLGVCDVATGNEVLSILLFSASEP